jgi:hypothetical protein
MEDMILILKEETFVVFFDPASAVSGVFLRRAAGDYHTWYEMKDKAYIEVKLEEVLSNLDKMYLTRKVA